MIVHAMGEDSPSYDLQWVQKGLLHEIANLTGGVAVLWGQRYALLLSCCHFKLMSLADITVAATTSSQTSSTQPRICAL